MHLYEALCQARHQVIQTHQIYFVTGMPESWYKSDHLPGKDFNSLEQQNFRPVKSKGLVVCK